MNSKLTTCNDFTIVYYYQSQGYLHHLYPYSEDALLYDGMWLPVSSQFRSLELGGPRSRGVFGCWLPSSGPTPSGRLLTASVLPGGEAAGL